MGGAGTAVLVVVLLLVLLALLWAVSTRAALVRMRDLAVEAGALAEQRRSRLADLTLHAGGEQEPDPQLHRAVADAEHRLAGDLAFHAAAVRAYDGRLAGVPASWVGALTGLHPLGAAADHER
ncbi:hypothetical protein GTQ99_12480 [Kineococcus sp. T13]|uniref:hypothetical protein n=1 Tax=Kineococcus vitellinus TaxID=2696565 RepID=UPI00141349C9|nr:hypothetical protein [Kineococcus vitellinus]NAZ76222.1 hypothetical protein [Kineococcus vitellinus]